MLQASTLRFLRDLRKNNNREWFEKNKEKYNGAKEDFESFIDALIKKLSALDPELSTLGAKDCVFRIYRDVRFSSNKDPYKSNFGASIKRGGRKSGLCGFYIHIEPEGGWGSFAGGGFWMPEAPVLKKLRQEIEFNHGEFESILNDRNFKRFFGSLEDHRLKKLPRGVDADHPAAELMKYTSYIVSHDLDNKLIESDNLIKECVSSYKAMLPFINFLNRALD